MHIGIDGYESNTDKLVGIGSFASEVIRHLYNIDRKNSYTIFLPTSPLSHLPKEKENWQYTIIPSKGFWTFTSLPFSIWTAREKIDVFFSPTHYIPRFVSIPRVVSIMDLSYLHYTEMFRSKDLYQLKNWTAYSIKNSKKIVTISEFTKSEIVKYYQTPKSKIVVAYPGLDSAKYQKININNQKNLKNIKKKYNIDGEYILFVGTLQPRKNILKLIDAFNRAMEKWNNEITKLVIVGKKGWLFKEIFTKVTDLKLNKRILFLDYISESDMPDLYRGAKCLALPSLYEGFGLPVIEAMACGIPTIISNTSSLPEIAGNATIYVDPESVDSISDGLIKILSMDEAGRNSLITRGLKNIQRFNWVSCSQQVLNVLEEVANNA